MDESTPPETNGTPAAPGETDAAGARHPDPVPDPSTRHDPWDASAVPDTVGVGPAAPGLPPSASSGPGVSSPPPPPPPPDPPPAPDPPRPEPPAPPAAGGRRPLRRDLEHRMLGGVAAGLAEFLDIDATVVRIAFVALAVLGGSGVLLYLAGWLLVPADDTGRTMVHDYLERRPRRRSLVALVAGVVVAVAALSNLFSSGPWWPHWDRGVGGGGFFLGLVGLLVAAVLLASSGRRPGSTVRWLAVTVLLAVLGIVVVAAATLFSVEAISGVPLRGGIGDTHWRPTDASQVARTYRLAIGTMELDLRDVTFRPGTTDVTASVGIGHLVVEVPPGPVVSVTARSGAGNVQVFGHQASGLSTMQTAVSGAAPPPPVPPAAPVTPQSAAAQQLAAPGHRAVRVAATTADGSAPAHIVLDAQVGVGQVQVFRATP